MDKLTATQLDAIDRMPAEQRYDYFIRQILEHQTVWGLSSAEGWVILPDADEEHLPVWSRSELAAAWATGEFSDCQPQQIPLADWLEKWLPGMSQDGLLVAVSPDSEGDCIIVAADELQQDIEAGGTK